MPNLFKQEKTACDAWKLVTLGGKDSAETVSLPVGPLLVPVALWQARRRELTATWTDWLEHQQVSALIEPTVPIVAPLRGDGYDHAGTDFELISLTHYWDWTGFPAVALPAGVGSRSGLPVGVSLIGAAGSDWELLSIGHALQLELGVPEPPKPASDLRV